MVFFRRAAGTPGRLGIFPGTFNPVTVAHMALSAAALAWVDEVVFVLPQKFPHKQYSGASFSERIGMLQIAIAGEARYSLASASGGLFVEIAEECRNAYGEGVELWFLCGRDAAERMTGWDYGRPEALAEMLRGFGLIVAARTGAYEPEAQFQDRVRHVQLAAELDGISATEIRRRVAEGGAWEPMTPPALVDTVRRLYGSPACRTSVSAATLKGKPFFRP